MLMRFGDRFDDFSGDGDFFGDFFGGGDFFGDFFGGGDFFGNFVSLILEALTGLGLNFHSLALA